tara:strand:- start:203 stop:703 length:501 start_codon:yes stop_codon:yes gene_type:complete
MSNYTKQNSLDSKEFDDAEEYVVFSPTIARPVLHIPNKSKALKASDDTSKKQNNTIVDIQPSIINNVGSEILSDAIYSGLKESTLDIGFKKETIAKIIKLVIEAVELSEFNGEEAKLYSLKILKALIHDCADEKDKEWLLIAVDENAISDIIDIIISATKGDVKLN